MTLTLENLWCVNCAFHILDRICLVFIVVPVLEQYLCAYCVGQSPSWEANQFSTSQEIPPMSWNPKVHYCVYKCPPPVPFHSQISPDHAPTCHFLKNHLNIILPSMPGSCKWSLSLRFPHQNPECSLPLPICASSWLDHPNNVWWGVQIIELLIM